MAHTKVLIVVGPLPAPPVATDVTSIRKSGETSGQTGDIVFAAGLGVNLLRADKTFTYSLKHGSLAFPIWQWREKHTAEIDGSTAAFTLLFPPVLGSEHVFLNGLLQDDPDDYSISGAVVTFVAPPAVGDKLLVTYESFAGSDTVDFTGPSLDFSKPSNSMYLGL